jgi:hypothetical protein
MYQNFRAGLLRALPTGETMDATTCPECGAPAEVTDRCTLESTDGPIEHLRVDCARRHWFLLSTATLHRARQPVSRSAAAATRSSVAVSATRTCRAPAAP